MNLESQLHKLHIVFEKEFYLIHTSNDWHIKSLNQKRTHLTRYIRTCFGGTKGL